MNNNLISFFFLLFVRKMTTELPVHLQKSIIEYTNIYNENKILLDIINVFSEGDDVSKFNMNIITELIGNKIHKHGLCKKMMFMSTKPKVYCQKCVKMCPECWKYYTSKQCVNCVKNRINNAKLVKQTLLDLLTKNKNINVMNELKFCLSNGIEVFKMTNIFVEYFKKSEENEILNALSKEILNTINCNYCKITGVKTDNIYYVETPSLYAFCTTKLKGILDIFSEQFIHGRCISKIIDQIDTIIKENNMLIDN